MLTAWFPKPFKDCVGGREEGNLPARSIDQSQGKRAINDGEQFCRRRLFVDREWLQLIDEIGKQLVFVLDHAAMKGMNGVRVFRRDAQERTPGDFRLVHQPVDFSQSLMNILRAARGKEIVPKRLIT